MRKRFCCLMVIVLAVYVNLTAYAADEKLVYTDFKTYTARVFVYDTSNDQVVLVNVAPIKTPYSLNRAPHIEYRALPVYREFIKAADGTTLLPETVNEYLLDSTATVVVGKNGYGYSVVCMQFK